MATNAVIGSTGKLYRTDVSPEVAFGEITSVSGPSLERPEVEVSHLDSTGVERIGGLVDGGTVEFSGNWIRNAQAVQFRSDVSASQTPTRTYRVEWPTSPRTTASFTGIPLTFNMNEMSTGEAVTFSASMRVSGSITWA